MTPLHAVRLLQLLLKAQQQAGRHPYPPMRGDVPATSGPALLDQNRQLVAQRLEDAATAAWRADELLLAGCAGCAPAHIQNFTESKAALWAANGRSPTKSRPPA